MINRIGVVFVSSLEYSSLTKLGQGLAIFKSPPHESQRGRVWGWILIARMVASATPLCRRNDVPATLQRHEKANHICVPAYSFIRYISETFKATQSVACG